MSERSTVHTVGSRLVRRAILVPVSTVSAGRRLLDVAELVESDPYLHVVFSPVPGPDVNAVELFLLGNGIFPLPWSEVLHTHFDLILSADGVGLSALSGPVIVVPADPTQEITPFGPDLVNRTPSPTITLSTSRQRSELRALCEIPTAPVTVIGDPVYDRLIASLPFRSCYRAAFRLASEDTLTLVSSASGSSSLFDRSPGLLTRLANELWPLDHTLLCLLDPEIWATYGARQVRAWAKDATRYGLVLIGPDVDWRVAVVAADNVIGDFGTVSMYAASIGRRVLLAHTPPENLAAGSPDEALARSSSVLNPRMPLRQQVANQQLTRPLDSSDMAYHLTSAPRWSGVALRALIYRTLGLQQPAGQASYEPVSVPATPGNGSYCQREICLR